MRPRLSLEEVKEKVEGSLGGRHRWLRDVSLFLCYRYTVETLKEFHGGMGESAISQAIGGLVRRMKRDRRLEKEISKIEMDLREPSSV